MSAMSLPSRYALSCAQSSSIPKLAGAAAAACSAAESLLRGSGASGLGFDSAGGRVLLGCIVFDLESGL